ncbi:hypothetical protein WKR98_13230 [Pigmentiphaga sp. YJ18]|uniref:DUF7940 domain-containing protein n=1 Tax=Pigmentiphaga sp. YJ18 TaxID=3134907 RepID=UPI00310FB110
MRLIDDAHTVWHRLWSVRLALLSALFAAADVALPLWQGLLPARTFAAISTLLAVAAAIARVIQQPALRGDGDTERRP